MTRALERLNQLAAVAAAAGELARSTLVHRYAVSPGTHFYLRTSHSDVHIKRHDLMEVVITAVLQPPVAWRVAAEQDPVGVYYVALRKMIIGEIASGRFEIVAPRQLHLILKLESVRLTLDGVTDMIDLPGTN